MTARQISSQISSLLTQSITLTDDGSIPAAPSFATQPSSVSTAEGNTATFTVVVDGFPTPTIQWQVDTGGGFANISGATSLSYTTPTLLIGDDGNDYRAVATNSEGSATSTAAALTVSAASGAMTFDDLAMTYDDLAMTYEA